MSNVELELSNPSYLGHWVFATCYQTICEKLIIHSPYVHKNLKRVEGCYAVNVCTNIHEVKG